MASAQSTLVRGRAQPAPVRVPELEHYLTVASTRSLLPIWDLELGATLGVEICVDGPLAALVAGHTANEAGLSLDQDLSGLVPRNPALAACRDLQRLRFALAASRRRSPEETLRGRTHGLVHLSLQAATLLEAPASQLLDLVRKSGIAPSCCCFEFRREAEARDTRSLAIAASELRAAGLHVALRNGRALDLEALLSLRPSIVRLTPDIVQGANPAELDCARRTVAVLRCIGAEPLMEGVEEAQAMEIARELGVRYGQPSYACDQP